MTSTFAPSNPVADGLEVKSTAFPPGRICGQRCVASPCASCVTGAGAPPAEGIRDKEPLLLNAAMIVPSSPQLAPRPSGASHNATAEPPSTEIFLSFPCAKKASHCPSGEKKEAEASCVPASSVALS